MANVRALEPSFKTRGLLDILEAAWPLFLCSTSDYCVKTFRSNVLDVGYELKLFILI